jgi:hypothetical protein
MNIEVLPPFGPPIGFDKTKVQQALAVANPGGTALSPDNRKKYRAALNDTLTAVTNANKRPPRSGRSHQVIADRPPRVERLRR